MANTLDGITKEVLDTIYWFANEKLEAVRQIIEKPINIHCAFRSVRYNNLVGGAEQSAHLYYAPYIAAVDFDANMGSDIITNCNKIRQLLLPRLEELDLRMEKNENMSWIHLDSKKSIGERYF